MPTGSTATAASSGSGAPSSQAITAAPAYAVEEGPPTQSVYLVLVLAALAVLLLSQAVRYLAVRLTMSGRVT